MMSKHPIQLAPSILTADFGNLEATIRAADEGGADLLHLDVMDGQFVPNISFGPMLIKSIRAYTDLPFDVHLMVQEPGHLLAGFAEAGANNITVHAEACLHLHRTLQQIRDLGCTAGVAINPATPIDHVAEVLELLELVLVMSVNPGFGGQRFIDRTHDRLRAARTLLDEQNPDCHLQVDGGVKAGNIAAVAASGADMFVVGSAVYSDGAYRDAGVVADNIAALRTAVAKGGSNE